VVNNCEPANRCKRARVIGQMILDAGQGPLEQCFSFVVSSL
jgi:hypothetical protein